MRLLKRNLFDLVSGQTIGKFEGKTVFFRCADKIDETTWRIFATFDKQDLLKDRPTQAFSFDVNVTEKKNKCIITNVPSFIMYEVW